MQKHIEEILSGKRFEFGKNWSRFIERIEDKQISWAEKSLKEMLHIQTLKGKTFLDVGCGSGLFSLAARNLGAQVRSFDFDPQSVASTNALKERYAADDIAWVVEEGSILDLGYLDRLGTYDIVYSWGVLHHTGKMWLALDNLVSLIASKGCAFIAIYNDQGRSSRTWLKIKKMYNWLPNEFRWAILLPAIIRLWGPTIFRDSMSLMPLRTWNEYSKCGRGMSPWRDVVDWVGGFPFEVAKPEEIFRFFRDRDFRIRELRTCAGGRGCNEYIFYRESM